MGTNSTIMSEISENSKGQLTSKTNCQAEDSSRKQTNEFVFTSMRRVFVRFLEESSARKKTSRDYLTFNYYFKSQKKGLIVCMVVTLLKKPSENFNSNGESSF